MNIPEQPDPKALLSIKEAARLTGVPAYTLRFWEKEFADFLKPSQTPGGQRRYDQASLQMVERIKKLVDEEKYSVAVVRGVLQQEAKHQHSIDEKRRHDEAIDLILDEIAAMVREKVMARLVRDPSSSAPRVSLTPLSALCGTAPAAAKGQTEQHTETESSNPAKAELREAMELLGRACIDVQTLSTDPRVLNAADFPSERLRTLLQTLAAAQEKLAQILGAV